MADYYVDSDVAGPGAGTIGDPWDDIASNINSLSAGDTMYLRGGGMVNKVYDESEINITVSGNAGNVITITPYQAELVEIQKNSYGEAFDIDGDYITIDGKDQLYINKNGTGGYAVRIDGDNVTIKDTEVANNSGAGSVNLIYFTENSGTLIDGCEIHDSFHTNTQDASGIGTNGATLFTIQNCTIYDCYGDGVIIDDDKATGGGWSVLNNVIYSTIGGDGPENGIDAKWNDPAVGRATIAGNTVYGYYVCTGTVGGTGDGDGEGITVHNSCDGVDVYDNIIYDCSSGIVVEDSVEDVVVRNNLIYDLHTLVEDPNAGANGVGALHINCRDTNFYNNTIHNSPVNSIIFWGVLSNVEIINNIFNDCGNIYQEGTAGKTVSHNCWQNCTETIAGAGDVNADPLFTDEAGDDYTLQAGSPCVDAGLDVGLPYFGSDPDMGAFEYEPPGGTVYVTVIVTVTTTET